MSSGEYYSVKGARYPISDHYGYPDTFIRRRVDWAYRFGIDTSPQLIEGRVTLDIGSCHGHGLEKIRNLEPKLLISADRWIDFLKKQRNSFSEISQAQLDLSDNLPFADKSIDSIFLSHVVEHLNNPSKVIQEISRVLKNDGKLFIATPYKKTAIHNNDDVRVFDEDSIRNIMTNSGLDYHCNYLDANYKAWKIHRRKILFSKISRLTDKLRLKYWMLWDKFILESSELTIDDFSVRNQSGPTTIDLLVTANKH